MNATRAQPPSAPALLVCSSGGHLAQLLALRHWWSSRDRAWVTSDTPQARSALPGETIVWGHFPTTRHLGNLVRNFFLAGRLLVLPRRRPCVIVSTGAGVAFPFFALGWLLRIPAVYIEVFDRIDSRTVTGRLCRPLASLFLVQWPEQRALYKGAILAGPLLRLADGPPASPSTAAANGNGGTLPLLLVTIGTDHHPFPRLLGWVERWLAAGGAQQVRVLIQHGATPSAGPGRVEQFGYDELQRALGEASVVITHAATTAIEARSAGRVPLVVARRPDLGEHVDDHQLRFARRLHADGLAVVCETEGALRDALGRSLAAAARADRGAQGSLATATGGSQGHGAPEPAGARRAGDLIDRLLSQRPVRPRRGDGRGKGDREAPRDDRGGGAPGLASSEGTIPEPAEWPAVTVVIPTLGRRSALLRRALAGVASQDYPGPIDCLVVLDQQPGAPDAAGRAAMGSSEPREEYAATAAAARDVGARVLPNHRAAGLAGSRNTGILTARSEFVAFCDDDDAWLPGKLRAQVAALVHEPGAALACCGIIIEYGTALHPRVHPRPTVSLEDLLRSRLAALHPSTFVARRAALLDVIGLVSEEIPGSRAEDYELLIRAARHGPVLNVPVPGVQVRWHVAGTAMQDGWQGVAEAHSWLLDRYPELSRVSPGYSRIAGKIAFAAAACGNRADAWTWARRAIRARPREPRPYLALAVMFGLLRPEWVIRALHRRGRGL